MRHRTDDVPRRAQNGYGCTRSLRTAQPVSACAYASVDGADEALTIEGVEPMGRGRAKAKQVKVARQLKYNSGGTDLDRLRSELGVGRDQQDADGEPVYADLADPYADHVEADDTGE